LLTLLHMRRRDGSEPQVIALSAVIGDRNGLERWLGGRLLRRVERPVPLDERALCCDGRFRYLDGDTGRQRSEQRYIRPLGAEGKHRDWVIPLVQGLVQEGLQVIVFRETTGEPNASAEGHSRFRGHRSFTPSHSFEPAISSIHRCRYHSAAARNSSSSPRIYISTGGVCQTATKNSRTFGKLRWDISTSFSMVPSPIDRALSPVRARINVPLATLAAQPALARS
jgi:hypothetical protein